MQCSYPVTVTEEPYSGIAQLSPQGEGEIKGSLKKAYLATHLAGNHTCLQKEGRQDIL